MTYYDHSDEYLFEWDVSNCGTGSYSCFYSSSYYFYSQWKMQWTTTPSSGYNGYGGTRSGLTELHQGDGGFLAISAKNGPQMNLIFHYDATGNKWGMVGIGDSTPEIETGKLAGGSSASRSSTYGYTAAYNIPLSGLDITGTFGKFDWNGTYSTSKANWLCAGTNGSITSTVQHPATLDVLPVTTMHTPPPTDGADLHLVLDTTDAWHPPVQPPTR